ncbi:F0F1 ATP synthase subunit B' [Histidinibacterium aquaticum]|uniref:ATP synthase subunit b n=1 Tax=Histidinibacterium aquaticum TaxID=2613962 RepID=A0A5J5GR68_9RHOB|nr:F0F1 ATP synthase subunit B' [Histidinibacterium aquaticum]KAA9010585.1 F0F1 ATP synthase subunit B' [Histidinibacterium aquaticum]
MAQHIAQAEGAAQSGALGEDLTEAGTTVASACVDSGGSAVGMPQLCGEWFPNQIFWLVVTLLVIYFVLSRVALPRIGAILAERQGTITNDIAAAEELKLKAQEAEEAYQKSLADARTEANRISEETRAEIQSELDAELAEADKRIAARTAESEKEIAAIRESALDSVRQVATDTAKEIVALMGKQDDAAVEAAVAERVKGNDR